MAHDIEETQVEAGPMACTTARVAWSELGTKIRPMFDQVYAFVREQGLTQAGHNVCVYAAPRPDGVELTCGVQVLRPFEASKDGVRCGRTPAGRAVTTVHTGEYSGLGKAHDALFAWAKSKDIQPAGPSWEVYGDWADDPAERRVDVYLLLEAAR